MIVPPFIKDIQNVIFGVCELGSQRPFSFPHLLTFKSCRTSAKPSWTSPFYHEALDVPNLHVYTDKKLDGVGEEAAKVDTRMTQILTISNKIVKHDMPHRLRNVSAERVPVVPVSPLDKVSK